LRELFFQSLKQRDADYRETGIGVREKSSDHQSVDIG
jgi:hypothetical protein